MAGTGVAITSGDMIPLLDDNGSGVFIKGRNNAHDIRAGLIGSMFLSGADGFIPRAGVLFDGGFVGSTDFSLRVDPQASPNQTVLIRRGRAIVPRSGQGPYLISNEVDQTVNMPAASGANTRYDIVCLAAFDQGNFVGDTAHGPQFWVESGTLGGGVPATPTGMLKLAEVFRAVNDNTISTEIVDKRTTTCVAGGVRQLGPGDSISDPGLTLFEYRDRGGIIERWNGTIWDQVGASTGPRGVLAEVKVTGANDSIGAAEVLMEFATINVKAGRRYRITWCCMASTSVNTSPMPAVSIRTASGASVNTGSTVLRAAGFAANNATNYCYEMTASFLATVDEQRTFGVTANSGGAGQTFTVIRGTTSRLFQIEDTGV